MRGRDDEVVVGEDDEEGLVPLNKEMRGSKGKLLRVALVALA
jgi:hypothetical protein